MRRLTRMVLISLTLGCTDSTSALTNPAPTQRTVQMDDTTLFVNGDTWLFSFPANDRQCFIVGADVAYVDRMDDRVDDHVSVNLILTETEKAIGKRTAMRSILYVPTDGRHPVLVVHPRGYTECSIEVPEQLNANAFIESVLSHPDVKGSITRR